MTHEETGSRGDAGEGTEEGAPRSEVEKGLASFGRALQTVAGKVLGPKAAGRDVSPDEIAISPEVDEAMAKAGEGIGRWLHAAGEGLKAHPLDPAEAIRTAREHAEDTVEADQGWSPLVTGLKDLGGGLGRVAEGVLDVVAPRKARSS